MAEEHKLQAPETHVLCANNCGFFGSPATLNLCSKCYRDHRLKEEQANSAKIAVEKSLSSSSATTTPEIAHTHRNPAIQIASASVASSPSDPPPSQPNRCSTCRKRVGLTGFRCRCGVTFCSFHRYPEQHGCTFDFKAAGKEEIARANPIVKAEKLEKI